MRNGWFKVLISEAVTPDQEGRGKGAPDEVGKRANPKRGEMS